ncbi:concanavalin A-like lectin/glucanase [Lophium mytilinum]|uniref:Concanavalin A-like lectin/glucanase n=1 Tax=Lophium mytilinum TaxID=390894 RepID=A0A6A6QCZ2_9PEZI|nr:concanavalin A-like lectin/glucanase [Lophium mytilinum]
MWSFTKAFGIWPCLFISTVSAFCECGYSVDPPTSFVLFTDLFENDFLHSPNLTGSGWIPQQYNVEQSDSRGPYGKQFTTSNVVSNPLKDPYSWAGDSVLGGDAGLQLWARKDNDGMIPAAEIATERTDFLYGSFRVGMKMSKVNGTCGAFFWFHNDSQEIDMEFLSKQFHPPSGPNTGAVNLVLQTPASLQAGYDASGTPDFSTPSLPFPPDAAYHDYRFDWSPDGVAFYADGAFLHVMNVSTPTSPGHLVLNHWSNGDPAWSGGPPEQDTAVTVSYIKAYFNSSDPAMQAAYRKRCPTYDAKRVCEMLGGVGNATNGTVAHGEGARACVKGWFVVVLAVLAVYCIS